MPDDKVISADLIADIFDIPTDGKNIVDDDENDMGFGNAEATISFDERSKDIQDTIANVPAIKQLETKSEPKPELKVEVKPEPKPEVKNVETVLVKTVKPKTKEPKASELDLFGSFSDPVNDKDLPQGKLVEVYGTEGRAVSYTVIEENKPNPLQTEANRRMKTAVQKAIESAAVEYEEDETEKKKYDPTKDENKCQQWSSDEQWLLKSPGPKYNKFYDEKQSILNDGPRGILSGGPLDFDKIFDELSTVTCDMTVSTYDPQAIYDKMIEIQKMRERVREIQLKVSRQYFLWERYIDLLRGVLCRTEYERGKQEGLNYEHLRDMEHYFCSLKALQRGTDTIFKTLDAAFDVLSRQVTIVMPMKDVERQMPNNNLSQLPRPMTATLKKFDSLGAKPDKPSDGSPAKGTGWNL